MTKRHWTVPPWLDRHSHLLMVLPGLLLLFGLVAYPVVWNLYNSFTNRSFIFPTTSFVGIQNYAQIFAMKAFWESIWRTVEWTVLSVLGQLVLGLVAALALQRVRQGQGAMRVALLIPWAFPSIVLAFTWRYLLDGLHGVVNDIAVRVGLLAEPITWFGNVNTALPALIVMNIWFGFPFMMVALLAAMQSIPAELYESAAVDGAGFWQETFYITLPTLAKLIGSLVLLRAVWVFNNFDFVFLTTGGGPVNATQTLPVFAYQIGWANGQLGKMAAVSVAVITVSVLIGVLVGLRRRKGDKS